MVIYETCSIYVTSQTTLQARIMAIEAVIDALITTGATAAGTDNIQEYSLNDGQTIIKTIYKGSVAVGNAINFWEAQKQRYINQLNGRMVRLHDAKNFNRRFNGFFHGSSF